MQSAYCTQLIVNKALDADRDPGYTGTGELAGQRGIERLGVRLDCELDGIAPLANAFHQPRKARTEHRRSTSTDVYRGYMRKRSRCAKGVKAIAQAIEVGARRAFKRSPIARTRIEIAIRAFCMAERYMDVEGFYGHVRPLFRCYNRHDRRTFEYPQESVKLARLGSGRRRISRKPNGSLHRASRKPSGARHPARTISSNRSRASP